MDFSRTLGVTLKMLFAKKNIEFICDLFWDATGRTGYVGLK